MCYESPGLPRNRPRRDKSPCIRTHVFNDGIEWWRILCPNLGQGEDGKNDTNGTDTHGEDGGSDLETGRAVVGVVTFSGVGRTGRGGPGAGGGNTRARSRGDPAGGGKSVVDGGRGISDTVGGGGDLGLVGHSGDGTQRLGRLSVGLDLTAGIGVDAGVVLVVALARLEGTVLGVVGGVVGASYAVIDMFAEVSSVGASRVADLDAEEVSTEEARTEA